MNTTRFLVSASFGATLLSMLSTVPAFGQSVDAGAPQPSEEAIGDSQDGFGEIVVTARRREERLQDIPATVAAVTGDALRSGGGRQLKDLAQSVSGLTFVNVGGAQPLVSTRGDANRLGITEPGTGFFIDGVYVNRQTQLGLGPVDAARVEFVKGPQSSLYGKNTIAGAVNIITNDPAMEPQGYIEAGIGTGAFQNELIWHALGTASVPLVEDKVAIRLTAQHQQREGYVVDRTNGERGLGYDATYLRAKLLTKLTDDLTWRVTATYRHDDSPRADVLGFGPGTNGVFNQRPGTGTATIGRTIWDTRTDQELYTIAKSLFLTSDLSLDTSIGTITSLTGYQRSRVHQRTDADTTELAVAATELFDRDNAFSQEFRIAGSGDGFTWLGGLYYLDDDAQDLTQFVYLLPASNQHAVGVGSQRITFPTGGTTKAVFGQLGYDLTSALNISGGLRYASDKREGFIAFDTFTTAGAVRPGGFRINRAKTFESVTGNVVASLKVADDVLAYASFATGNKQGGFSAANNALAASVPFKEQTVRAYEAGIKSDLFDRRVRLNVASFLNNYDDLQINQLVALPVPGSTAVVTSNITTNAGSARAYGADVELMAKVADPLELQFLYTYLHSRIGEYAYAPGVTLRDIPTTRSPKHSGTVGVTYRAPLLGNDFSLNGNVVFKSRFTNDIVYAGGTLFTAPTSGYHVFNARASYEIGSVTLSAYVNNIANKQYTVAQSINNPAFYYYRTPGEPRTFEVSIAKRF